MHIRDRFDKAVDMLYETNHYLAAEVTKLGYPKMLETGYPPTAGVAWDAEKKKISFLFNRKFAESLSDEEFAFVVAHEAIHVINMHIFLFHDEATKMQKRGKKNSEVFQYIRKLNVAADCVVNDSLTRLYEMSRVPTLGFLNQKVRGGTFQELAQAAKCPVDGLKVLNPDVSDPIPPGTEMKIPLSVLYGENVVETHCEDLTVMEVYALLPEDAGEEGGDGVENHEGWQSFLNEDGSLNEDFVDAVKGFVEDNLENSALSDEEAEAVEGMKDDMTNSSDRYAQKAGSGTSSKNRSVDGLGNNSINWNRLVWRLTETKKPRDIWNRAPRKMMSVYPDVILPSMEDEEREDIFIAIDTSGSIDRHALSLLVDVVKSTPKRFNVQSISFDTRCYEYDIKSDEGPRGGGGTAFNIIERYIQENLKKYPKAIFVLTDGCNGDGYVSPEHPERWCWLLYGASSDRTISHMQCHSLKDLLR